MSKTALFPGTFNPFTIGHYSLVKRALTIFDKVIIAIGINSTKENNLDEIEENKKQIADLFKNENVKVITYTNLTADIVKAEKASCIVRGIRGISDYEYEKNMADINKELFEIETVFLFSDLKYAHISSSLIRELKRFGKEYKHLLPES
ncbi:MAG: pantetheine-phosphate adenylyltransferase [Paludibacteraceae bacterium]|mgnify:CR=1 FL=1|jgi:pantetheine-phosphate adenylyltransferase|nr:pantetheine-phosphate adenylyltransferase [Paludibacteraceae bacterium]NLK92958.1 pantetheine-phosphate adenylyltransferase [Bacteroidales bacterium]MBP6436108.1 pantetheine-phosphate adenylyltransferase [Paludibacteraceae bacterium]MBP8627353.1 pantetheine-phosphate adenylyltransferase [Paludibacteraceae bacterium]MBP9647926.1 pantetheine-phosphate adenylyltransferase [Paludibacteraceae bacterium]